MRRFKSISRLLIIFILAVSISGSTLVWFSVKGISNLQVITEKRVFEEQQELKKRIELIIQTKLESLTKGFINEIDPLKLLKDSLINSTINNDFIVLPIILKKDGSFLFPNFKGIVDIPNQIKFSNNFNLFFSKGQEAEFKFKNLKTAKNQYLQCLKISRSSYDSVKSLNAVGRVAVKENDIENAIEIYNLILSKYSSVVSEDGIPFVQYALPQLLKITKAENYEHTLNIIEFFLKKMQSGLIALNFNSKDLLIQIRNWLKNKTFENTDKLVHIYKLEKNIILQLKFIDEYTNEFTEFLKIKGKNPRINDVNGYRIVNSFSGNSQDLLLANIDFNYPVGFLVKGDKLFDFIIKNELQYELDFDYNIIFPTLFNSDNENNALKYSSQLNPFFSGQTILIELKDENIIKELIRRKSWAYGIATLLLVLALTLGVVLIIRDVSREKKMAGLQADFISNVTHELKTPLTSIHMFTELILLKKVTNEHEKNEYLSIILKESERLKRMIKNILDFSKLEKGIQEYNFVRTNIGSILKAAIHDMDYWLEKEKFLVITQINEDIYAKVDPEKFKQVIDNLISNAIKYSIDTKTISFRSIKKKKKLIIEIEDEGIGISQNDLNHIFEKFYRADQKEGIGGTGLGLTVVKEIIMAHGGEISVTSKIGKGSKFSITLND